MVSPHLEQVCGVVQVAAAQECSQAQPVKSDNTVIVDSNNAHTFFISISPSVVYFADISVIKSIIVSITTIVKKEILKYNTQG